MAYRKRSTSLEQEKAQARLDGIKQFEPTLDFGKGLTESDYTNGITAVDTLTKDYNAQLIKADGIATQLDKAEKDLSELSKRFLNVVGAKYGYDSVEYEKAGGVRTSDYKRSTKKSGATLTT